MLQELKAIEQIIRKAAIDGNLTEEAISTFHGTLESEAKLAKEVETLEAKLEQQNKAFDLLRQERDEARAARDALMTRKTEVEAREKNMTKLELEAEYHRIRVEDHKEMMKTVFKPHVVRESVYRNGQQPDRSGYTHNSSENEDRTLTHE